MDRRAIHIDVCSGIGAFGIAAHHAGFETAAFCEIEPYPRRVLARHFPKAYIHDDLKTLTAGTLRERGIQHVSLFSGGIPCQPFSLAGKQAGTTDNRHLWPEAYRLIQDLRPDWVCIENVAGFIPVALDLVLSELEAAGYTAGAVVLPACSVNAPHQRERVWIVAHSRSTGDVGGWECRASAQITEWHTEKKRRSCPTETARCCEVAGVGQNDTGNFTDAQAHTPPCPLGSQRNARYDADCGCGNCQPGTHRWEPEPRVGRMPDGIASWLDGLRWPAPFGAMPFDWEPSRTLAKAKHRKARLKACGNAIVWPVAACIFAAIRETLD